MFKIVCEFCGTENLFEKKEEAPSECSNKACQNSLDKGTITEVIKEIVKSKMSGEIVTEVNDNIEESEKEIIALELIYQKNNQKINVNAGEKVTIGRESYGNEVLGNISQISRNHCTIEFSENCYKITDLNSTNGTFIGLGNDKTSCKTTQVIYDKDFLVLGKEVFLARYIFNEKNDSIQSQATQKDTKKLCSECSAILKNLPCSCPECGAWNE